MFHIPALRNINTYVTNQQMHTDKTGFYHKLLWSEFHYGAYHYSSNRVYINYKQLKSNINTPNFICF